MPSQSDKEVLETMREVREICKRGHQNRQKSQIKLSQPLAAVYVVIDDAPYLMASGERDSYEKLIKDELNVKEIRYVMAM